MHTDNTLTSASASTQPTHTHLIGIVPRAIQTIFERVQEQRNTHGEGYKCEVMCSFLELYNEELIDLLNPQVRAATTGRKPSSALMIREDAQGGIYWSGVKEEPVVGPDDLFA